MNLNELDAVMTSAEMPVRPETLAEAWDMTAPVSRRGVVMLVVTMRARPGQIARLVEATREFVDDTGRLAGSIGSTLYQSALDPDTVFLLERFTGEEPFARHMASEYFARFQRAQTELLAEPVAAVFFERGSG